jgi:hypothetical protein
MVQAVRLNCSVILEQYKNAVRPFFSTKFQGVTGYAVAPFLF